VFYCGNLFNAKCFKLTREEENKVKKMKKRSYRNFFMLLPGFAWTIIHKYTILINVVILNK